MERRAAAASRRSQALEALKESEERFRLIFEQAPISMAISDLRGRFLRVNQAMAELLGYPAEQFASMDFRDVTHPEDLQKDLAVARQLLHGETSRISLEKRYVRQNGEVIYVTMHLALMRDAGGEPRYFIGQVIDITEHKHHEQTIRHMAYHDPLTGLSNRVLFRDKLAVALSQARTNAEILGVIFLDLDRFKIINDTLGHNMGDQALKLIAERLVSSVRNTDLVARLGGDEFTVMLPNIIFEQDVFKVLDKVMHTLEQPIYLGGERFTVSASIGVALYPRDGEDIDSLLQVADMAMYAAKQKKGIEP
jgi:diguanylate cyclase (GGDEF)-like protein/PAS domain S-box-containing protein